MRLLPNASRDAIVGIHGEQLKIRLTAAPERGKANAALIDFLSACLELPKSSCELIDGMTNKNKVVLFKNQSRERLAEKLLNLLV